ncbi:unnamed protein product [Closterium sp. NIES-65]|nr:unnamed protein product [Closterium sp. NIES-65]
MVAHRSRSADQQRAAQQAAPHGVASRASMQPDASSPVPGTRSAKGASEAPQKASKPPSAPCVTHPHHLHRRAHLPCCLPLVAHCHASLKRALLDLPPACSLPVVVHALTRVEGGPVGASSGGVDTTATFCYVDLEVCRAVGMGEAHDADGAGAAGQRVDGSGAEQELKPTDVVLLSSALPSRPPTLLAPGVLHCLALLVKPRGAGGCAPSCVAGRGGAERGGGEAEEDAEGATVLQGEATGEAQAGAKRAGSEWRERSSAVPPAIAVAPHKAAAMLQAVSALCTARHRNHSKHAAVLSCLSAVLPTPTPPPAADLLSPPPVDPTTVPLLPSSSTAEVPSSSSSSFPPQPKAGVAGPRQGQGEGQGTTQGQGRVGSRHGLTGWRGAFSALMAMLQCTSALMAVLQCTGALMAVLRSTRRSVRRGVAQPRRRRLEGVVEGRLAGTARRRVAVAGGWLDGGARRTSRQEIKGVLAVLQEATVLAGMPHGSGGASSYAMGKNCKRNTTVAEAGQFIRSLFEHLQGNGWAVQLLSVQYRMHPSISAFPLRCFYRGRIQNGANVCRPQHSPQHLFGAYRFFHVKGREEREGGAMEGSSRSIGNSVESALVLTLLHRLAHVCRGAAAHMQDGTGLKVGGISPYKQAAGGGAAGHSACEGGGVEAASGEGGHCGRIPMQGV